MTECERPNTVSGLVAKHKELRKLREQYRKEVKKLTISISHIEACIRLFDPKANTSTMGAFLCLALPITAPFR
jgi:hypothetical protein